MRFTSLGSGSEGNALLVETTDGHSTVRVLIDCGFGLREAQRRLRAAGCEPEALSAILVTHEHGDHIGGVFRLAASARVPVYLTHGTLRACGGSRTLPLLPAELLRFVDPQNPFVVGGFRIEPIAVPHDAAEPVQYLLDDGRARLGVLTDLGHGTAHVQNCLTELDAFVLECNHDTDMLATNPRYPPSLRRRIAGPWGHLDNLEAARILAALDQRRLRRVVAAHLSKHNNRPDIARNALAGALGASTQDVMVADQASGLGWINV